MNACNTQERVMTDWVISHALAQGLDISDRRPAPNGGERISFWGSGGPGKKNPYFIIWTGNDIVEWYVEFGHNYYPSKEDRDYPYIEHVEWRDLPRAIEKYARNILEAV